MGLKKKKGKEERELRVDHPDTAQPSTSRVQNDRPPEIEQDSLEEWTNTVNESGHLYESDPEQMRAPYLPLPAPQVNAVVIHTTLGPYPCDLICPTCHNYIKTRTYPHYSWKAHFFACLCCTFGCYFCSYLPYRIMLDKTHVCPVCESFVGEYRV
ncbi:uncharacterized protein LOC109600739 [Aethina tumida]|uniref:uncharacterized protein LOC109600739 n=1 Tax=Aethina tumida TaxID=116153 RepID=UPI0021472E50|nr:uncharacterized protein LOC109600739 [Aethina tumida]